MTNKFRELILERDQIDPTTEESLSYTPDTTDDDGKTSLGKISDIAIKTFILSKKYQKRYIVKEKELELVMMRDEGEPSNEEKTELATLKIKANFLVHVAWEQVYNELPDLTPGGYAMSSNWTVIKKEKSSGITGFLGILATVFS